MSVCRLAGRFVLRAGLTCALLALVVIGIGPVTGRYRVVTVLTGSMRPTAAPGAMVLSTPEPASSLRVGDVITFQAPVDGHPVVTHRVVEIVEGGDHPVIRTKGDANDAPDPWDARIGDGPVWRMRAVIPGAGHVMAVMRTPLFHRLTVLAAPLAFVLLAVVGIWKDEPDP